MAVFSGPGGAMRPGTILGERNGLMVRSANGGGDVDAAQHLRYRVFYEELSATPDPAALAARRYADRYDALCDHLLVVSQSPAQDRDPIMLGDGELVGCYRVLRQSVAEANGGFYTQDEFDLAPLIGRKRDLNFLELGRSCVLQPYRTRPVVELLWQGIWNYVRAHGFDVMMGCASLEGTDPDAHSVPLSFMAQNCAAPEEWRVRALGGRYVEMNRLPRHEVNPKTALRALPPLIKGYLRLGCYIGEGAVIDHQFNTIDVLIMLPVSAIEQRYLSHFGAPDEEPR
jgi:L-ornithine Nalpha-acyltransferase